MGFLQRNLNWRSKISTGEVKFPLEKKPKKTQFISTCHNLNQKNLRSIVQMHWYFLGDYDWSANLQGKICDKPHMECTIISPELRIAVIALGFQCLTISLFRKKADWQNLWQIHSQIIRTGYVSSVIWIWEPENVFNLWLALSKMENE